MHIQIAIARPSDLRATSMVALLTPIWQSRGHRVEVTSARRLTGDVALLHIDRTVIPGDLLPRVPAGTPLLNGAVRDISKRRISRYLVEQDSPWNGPVIVKTNANAFGGPDRRLRGRSLRERLAFHLPWRWIRTLRPRNYPILPSVRAVPAWVWRRSDLVVEKFRPEHDGTRYKLRTWVFFGDRGFVHWMASPSRLVKGDNVVAQGFEDEVPSVLAERRRELGFDFGKWDFVVSDGEVVLLDVNSTPVSRLANREAPERMEDLATGIDSFVTAGARC